MTRRSSPRAQVRAFFREISEEEGGAGAVAQDDALLPHVSQEPSPGLAPLGHPLPQAGEGKEETLAGEGKKEMFAPVALIAAAESSDGAAHRHTNTSVFTSAQATQATERARALYEDTAVPVREIARRCGVTERTILKYARKLDWKPRYHWIGGAAGERHRRWKPAEKFAPAKGAGARFIAREDIGKPFPVGLKAHDPEAAAFAAADCERAQAVAREAEARAAQARQGEEEIAIITAVHNALAAIPAWRLKRAKDADRAARDALRAATDARGIVWRDGMAFNARRLAEHEQRKREQDRAGEEPPDRVERVLWLAVALALSHWEAHLDAAMPAAPG